MNWLLKKADSAEALGDRLKTAMVNTDKALEQELEKSIDSTLTAFDLMFGLSSIPSHTIVDEHVESYRSALERMGHAKDELEKLIADAEGRLLKVKLAMEAAAGALSVLTAGVKPANAANTSDLAANDAALRELVPARGLAPVQGMTKSDMEQSAMLLATGTDQAGG